MRGGRIRAKKERNGSVDRYPKVSQKHNPREVGEAAAAVEGDEVEGTVEQG
jgi:hypothetical protein